MEKKVTSGIIERAGTPQALQINRISVEQWGKRKVFVARVRNKVITWRNVKGSKLSLDQAATIFKTNGTFNPKSPKVTRVFFKNVIETTIESDKPPRTKQLLQAIASGSYMGKEVIRAGSRIGNVGIRNTREAREHAIENFYASIGELSGQGYDAEIGREIYGEDREIKIRWRYYSKRK